jgi:hypothetical protein
MNIFLLQLLQAVFEHQVDAFFIFDCRLGCGQFVKVRFMLVALETIQQVLGTDSGFFVDFIEQL